MEKKKTEIGVSLIVAFIETSHSLTILKILEPYSSFTVLLFKYRQLCTLQKLMLISDVEFSRFCPKVIYY